MDKRVSSCCKEPVKVEGRTTLYYVCTKCGEACDGIACLSVKDYYEDGAAALDSKGTLDKYLS